MRSIYSWKPAELWVRREEAGDLAAWGCPPPRLWHTGASTIVGLAWKACSLAVKGTDLIWSRRQKTPAGKGLQLSQPEAEVPAVVTDNGGTGRNLQGEPGNETAIEGRDDRSTHPTYSGHSRGLAQSKTSAALKAVWALNATETETQTQTQCRGWKPYGLKVSDHDLWPRLDSQTTQTQEWPLESQAENQGKNWDGGSWAEKSVAIQRRATRFLGLHPGKRLKTRTHLQNKSNNKKLREKIKILKYT